MIDVLKNATYVFLVIFVTFGAMAEGSKNLTPNNGDLGFLQHDDGGNSNGFLKSTGTADERLYVFIKNGETFYYGLHRRLTNSGTTQDDLTILLYDNADSEVSSNTLLRDQTSGRQSLFQTPQSGVINDETEALAGPEAIILDGSGYSALSYVNNTGTDQAFYIVFRQGATDNGVKSWYDIWDFSVYDGSVEKPGRLYSKGWSFTTASGGGELSSDFQLFALVPSVIGGGDAGFYVKEIDISGMRPFGTLIYANSTGTDGTQGDTNGDGLTNFLDERMSQTSNSAALEFDLFVNNPDISLFPTTILPSVIITDANFYCNAAGTGGEAVISFTTNQTGIVSILLDLNGISGYQDNSTDVVIEQELDASSGSARSSVRWDGLDGQDNIVPSGTVININGRFTAGPIHVPIYDPEVNASGVNMLDVRPASSFDLIYWDDRAVQPGLGSSLDVQLSGTNSIQHTWTNGDVRLVNTWSFGYYEVNSQNVTFTYKCDADGDGINNADDVDSDNDGV
ncbi:MAG: hypothetical protein ACI9A7_002178, partial [Cyclobacteriaceae bacterium]